MGSSAHGSSSSKSLFKNFNNFMAQTFNNPAVINPALATSTGAAGLSKSTIQSLEKLRNVRSLTPEKQLILNSQPHKTLKQSIGQSHKHSSFIGHQKSPGSNNESLNTHDSRFPTKKHSLASNKSRLNSGRLSNSKSTGPVNAKITQ